MSRPGIIKKLKEKHPELSKPELEEILEIFSTSIKKALQNGQKVEIRDFGTFWVKRISERKTGRNPKTGESIYVPQKNKLRFKASKFLRNFVNKD